MTDLEQKYKDLLLRDLCARLPYGLKGKCEIDASYDTSFDTIYQLHKFDAILDGIKEDLLFVTPLIEDMDEQDYANEEVAEGIDILDFNPYLRPMSSMTEEERIFIEDKFNAKIDSGNGCYIETYTSSEDGLAEVYMEDVCELIAYLNSRHLDYHRKYDKKDKKWKSMIDLGLALPAPEGMYNF